MNKFLFYYQKELNFIKQHAKIFSTKFPKVARRLGFSEGETEDPHISRLIESFALLTSRIHQRMDEEMPELIEAILYTIAPQFLNPIPSYCIVALDPNMKTSGMTAEHIISANTAIYHKHIEQSCQFRTAYEVIIQPISINYAKVLFDKNINCWKLNLTFQVWPGASITNNRIRIFIHGPNNIANLLYTHLSSEIKKIIFNYNNLSMDFSGNIITSVGFNPDEGLISRQPRIAPAHLLLLDYFSFPQKFLFIDIHLPDNFSASDGENFKFEFIFNNNPVIGELEKISDFIKKTNFRLNCTPAVNLFPDRANAISFTDTIAEYPIVPSSRDPSQYEVWSVNDVSFQKIVDNKIITLKVNALMESHFHDFDDNNSGLYWQSFRRESLANNDFERKLYIAFSKHSNQQHIIGKEVISLNVMCTNHLIPNTLKYGNDEGDFDSNIPLSNLKISALTHPTKPIYPPDKSSVRWRFLSQLSLNHQILDEGDGAQKLKEILSIYNFNNNSTNTSLLNKIKSLKCKPITKRIIKNNPYSLARGLEVEIKFSHDALNDPDYYIFCCLLEHLLALYVPINSFVQMKTCIENENETLRIWPIRAGRTSWL
ncbi:type VI secretion system baseplate subunit TssF [Hafnia paralvei]|uniref:type VI secretion system baseplate subunit TssF n=1 Tax=Hafnia paralvei TaxID=546367 RepID=UPI000DF26D73|nr:type VI secretion system baseplate subunit TssF [Hafnia paralvei]RDA61904.1 type VI secretion system baseplate subunit TssF [Hafnia paralvei]RDA62965.1 type VI secretion system baseplate subunit TssF [Hafnia paralvei]RDA63805.1 type VI secretion system baseplate subunit TssF [Hafnia paralvei]RDA75091.1 type VI secretion system baseplate subunit TssF [Hafnia paralvei]RDA75495.1 type VI secretion system baseplate subunit TssF [Hafnia paralvei]